MGAQHAHFVEVGASREVHRPDRGTRLGISLQAHYVCAWNILSLSSISLSVKKAENDECRVRGEGRGPRKRRVVMKVTSVIAQVMVRVPSQGTRYYRLQSTLTFVGAATQAGKASTHFSCCSVCFC